MQWHGVIITLMHKCEDEGRKELKEYAKAICDQADHTPFQAAWRSKHPSEEWPLSDLTEAEIEIVKLFRRHCD